MKLNVKKISRALVVLLAIAAVVQIGSVLAETAFTGNGNTTVTSDEVNTDISKDVLQKLKDTAPDQYDEQVQLFKSLLVDFDVHEKFKAEIERLILKGKSLPDLLVAYEFLYHQFGKKQELEALVNQKESGKAWSVVFADYDKSHKDFTPRSFEPEYLESLTASSQITPDDIMLADRISVVSGTPVADIIEDKLEAQLSWKQIAAKRDIFHSASTLPRVRITEEQLAKYVSSTFSKQKVSEAFVLAQKLGETPSKIVGFMKSGKTEEAIMAESYTAKYN